MRLKAMEKILMALAAKSVVLVVGRSHRLLLMSICTNQVANS